MCEKQVAQKFCFICGGELKTSDGLGFNQCSKCGECFQPILVDANDQHAMVHVKTPFSFQQAAKRTIDELNNPNKYILKYRR